MPNPRKPRQLKIVHGTLRADRNPTNEPAPELVREVPQPPDYFSKYAVDLWNRLAGELVEKEILTVVDLPALEMICINYSLYRESYDAIYFPLNTNTKRKRKRTLAEYLFNRNSQTMPELTTLNKAFTAFKSLIVEFGLTPVSRNKIDLPDVGKVQDEMEKLWNEI